MENGSDVHISTDMTYQHQILNNYTKKCREENRIVKTIAMIRD